MNASTRPVPRPRVFAGAVILFALIAGLIVAVEALRHPLPEGIDEDVGLAEDDSDPRLPTVCEESLPREGQERATDQPGQAPGGELGPSDDVLGNRPATVTSSELYDCPQLWDGATVRYTGEVIGAVLRRDGGAWVQLNDDVYANLRGPLPAHRDYRGGNAGIGVHIPPDLADQIEWVGGPDTRGDRLVVTGTFHRVDPATAEVAVIRAGVGQIEQRGSRLERADLPDRRRLAILAAAVAIVATVAERVVARRR